ncbi:MAG: YlbF family regulator [Acetivibrio ethanolgignens]
MHRVEEETYELVAAIKDSREYSQYHWLYSEIKKDEKLLKRLNAFRRRRFELEMTEIEEGLEAQRGLAAEFNELLIDPLVAQFLSAEYKYCKMVRQAVYRITECLDMEIDFLEE